MVCTENHLIYTQDGYKKASEVNCNDRMFILQKESCEKGKGEKHSKVLFFKMFNFIQLFRPNYEKKNRGEVFNCKRKKAKIIDGNSKMRIMCKGISNKEDFKKAFLWNKLFGKMENVTRRLYKKSLLKRIFGEGEKDKKSKPGKVPRKVCRVKEAKVRKDEEKQPHVKAIQHRQVSGNKEKKRNAERLKEQQRREWKNNRTPKGVIRKIKSIGVKSCFRIPCWYERFNEKVPNPNKLQIGHWVSRIKNFDRSGWEKPFKVKSNRKRQEEGPMHETEGVEHVEVLQQSDYGKYGISSGRGDKVYCLEVNKTHNFYANGILVHNCKNPKSIRSKICKELAKNIDYIFLLTGTAIMNKPVELVNPLNILGKFNELFGGWKSFIYRFCDAYETPFGLDVKGASNTLELNAILKENCYFRREKREVLKDLPDIQTNILDFDINNKREYKKAENNLIEYITENKGKIKAESAKMAEFLVMRNTLRQLSGLGKVKDIKIWIDKDRKSVV